MNFSKEQLEAIDKIKNFIQYDTENTCISLIGPAGTGKTSITKEIINFLDKNPIEYVLAAPTHKAKLVLEELSGASAQTIHSLLALTPNIDIFELDYRDLKFKMENSSKSNCIPYRGVVIIDEASMINDDLFEAIMEKAKMYYTKVIFQGDKCQLNPVKQSNFSKVFSLPNKIVLTKIYRQKEDSPVLDYLGILREKPLDKAAFKTSIGLNDSIIVYNSPNDFLKKFKKDITLAISSRNPFYCKLAAYTNERVNIWNNYVRKVLYSDRAHNSFNIGEIVMGGDNFEYDGFKFWNSLDYIVEEVSDEFTNILPEFGEARGFYLTLYDTVYNDSGKVFILSNKNRNSTLQRIAEQIEKLRIDAINNKYNKREASIKWRKYFSLINSFACTKDLFFENRVVKKSTFNYGYACTIHKLQGSSINQIYIDMIDVLKQKNEEELRQLQYVAMSRTRNNVYLYL